ncbi:MAG: Trk system potassium transporter TrkA [Clostridia bacterium]|nr:Trk system potassium transporter TrkA [Clostridia bacterium]
MKIIIVGDGKVGATLVEHLSQEGHDVIVIDKNQKIIEQLTNSHDVMGICGNGASYDVQIEAGVSDAQLFIAATSSDELNILSCLMAKKAGAEHTIARVRTPDYLKQIPFFKDELGLSMVVNPEYDAANEIAKVLRFPNATNIETFYRGLVDLAEIKLEEDNPLCNMAIIDIFDKFGIKVLICAVQRKNEVVIPRGDFILKAGDRIHITAPRGVLVSFMKKLKIYKHRTRDIMITGGGKMGYYLARQLCDTGGYNVKIIENDEKRCDHLCDIIPEANIIHGDGTDISVLLEQGIENQDAFVALTTIDEENIISAMYANSLGIRKTVAKVNRVSYNVLESIGMDSAFSSKAIAANRIVAYVRALENSGEESSVQTLYKLVGGQVEALEFNITADFEEIGVPLRDIRLKKDTLIACIIRNHKVLFPGGNDCIEKDDSVIIVTKRNHISSINEIFE